MEEIPDKTIKNEAQTRAPRKSRKLLRTASGNLLDRTSLDTKFLLILVSSVIASIALLSFFVVKRETLLIQTEYKRDADIILTAISMALRDNMMTEYPDETIHSIAELGSLEGVKELIVMKPDGSCAFGSKCTSMPLSSVVLQKMKNGEEISITTKDGSYFGKPLLNENRCMSCHHDKEKVRGMVLCKISSGWMDRWLSELIMRMSIFGVLTALCLSGVLIVMSRRLILSPVKGLTEAAIEVTEGNFVLFRPRGTNCAELKGCKETGCRSYHDTAVPCWLRTDRLCCNESSKKVSAATTEECLSCSVFKKLRGDEIIGLQDSFNIMSQTLKNHEVNTIRQMREIEDLNLELGMNNAKLTTLLNASRLATSSIVFEQTLSTSLGIMLAAAGMEAGALLHMEGDNKGRCHDFFSCDAYNCPAYKSEVQCWRIAGTMCLSDTFTNPSNLTPMKYRNAAMEHTYFIPVMNLEEKIKSCRRCEFFKNIPLVTRKTAGFLSDISDARYIIDREVILKALLEGRSRVSNSVSDHLYGIFGTETEIAIPMKMHEQVIGVFYIASALSHEFQADKLAFLQSLSEVLSSAVLNSRLFEDIEQSYLQTVMAFANAVEAKDYYTRGHSERVAEMSMKIGDAMNLSKQEKDCLRFASILHDVGKISLSVIILRKDSWLDADEMKYVRSHPEAGVQILKPINFLGSVLPVIRHHHEKFDGSGYPLGLKGREIPLLARIICVADAWDAMRSDRPYRGALSVQEATEELLSHAGTQFDAEIVEIFLHSVEHTL